MQADHLTQSFKDLKKETKRLWGTAGDGHKLMRFWLGVGGTKISTYAYILEGKWFGIGPVYISYIVQILLHAY